MIQIRKTTTAVLAAFGVFATASLAAEPTPEELQLADDVKGGSLCEKYSAGELETRATKMVRSMEKRLGESYKLLEKAIQDGNVEAQNSRNESITQMKGLVKLSEEYLLSLQQHSAEGDCKKAEHQYVKISIAFAKVSELFAQVRSAGGVDGDIEELQDVQRDTTFLGDLPFDIRLAETFFGDLDILIPDEPIRASPYF